MLRLLLHKKQIPRILMVYTFKLTYYIPQAATSTVFKGTISAIPHLEKFGLRLECFK